MEGIITGKIVVKSKNSQFKVQIPYQAHVTPGRLEVNSSVTQFHLKDDDVGQLITRNLTVTNRFLRPLAIHNITLPPEAAAFFTLTRPGSKMSTAATRLFTPVVLQPGQTKDLITLTLRAEAWETRILNSHLVMHTNISGMSVPLVCFHGKVDTFFPGSPTQEILDYGTLGMGEKRDLYFTILNRNPVPVTLRGWGANLTGTLVELMGVAEGNETDILEKGAFSDMSRKLNVPPGFYMVFRIGIHTTEKEGATNGSVYVETDYHTFYVPFRFRVAKGSLHTVPRELIFDSVFPVSLC